MKLSILLHSLLYISYLLAVYSTTQEAILNYDSNTISGTTWLNSGSLSGNPINLAGTIIATKSDGSCGFKSVCFNPTLGCLRVDVDISPSSYSSLTIELYAYQLSIANNYGWTVSQDNNGYDRTIIMHDTRYKASGSAHGLAQGTGSTYIGHQPLNNNEWSHIIGIWDGSTNKAKLYVNDDTNYIETTITNDNGHSYFCLNTNPSWPGHQWDGCFSKVSIYDYALNNAEIVELKSNFDACLVPPILNYDSSTINGATWLNTGSLSVNPIKAVFNLDFFYKYSCTTCRPCAL